MDGLRDGLGGPLLDEADVHGVHLDPDAGPPEAFGYGEGCAGSRERVEDEGQAGIAQAHTLPQTRASFSASLDPPAISHLPYHVEHTPVRGP